MKIIEIKSGIDLPDFLMQEYFKRVPVLADRIEADVIYCDNGGDGWTRLEGKARLLKDPISGRKYIVDDDWFEQAYLPKREFETMQRTEWSASFSALLTEAIAHIGAAAAKPGMETYQTSHALLTRLVHALGRSAAHGP